MTGETTFQRPALRSHPRTWWRRLFRGWTLLAWLAAAVLAVYLASTDTRFGEMVGVVESVVEPVAPLETARLVAVKVVIGQRVKAGEVVATMDTRLLDEELRVVEAEATEERETSSGYQRDILQMVQRAESAVLDAETALEAAKIQQSRDGAELAELKKEQRRREDLLAKRLVSEELASALRPAISALEAAVVASPALIQVQKHRLEQARKERGDMEVWLRVGKDKDVSAAIGEKVEARTAIVASKRNQVALRRENYELRAARDGVVSLILHNPGDVVSAGDPVVRVIAGSNQVVGFLPEIHLSGLTIGEKVSINRSTGRGSSVGGVVEAIGPEVQTLPGRISPIPGQALRGRRVMVKLAEMHNFIPGETVTIGDTEPFWIHLTRQISQLYGR